MDIEPISFYPKPKVDSQILEIIKTKKTDLDNESDFFNFVKVDNLCSYLKCNPYKYLFYLFSFYNLVFVFENENIQ